MRQSCLIISNHKRFLEIGIHSCRNSLVFCFELSLSTDLLYIWLNTWYGSQLVFLELILRFHSRHYYLVSHFNFISISSPFPHTTSNFVAGYYRGFYPVKKYWKQPINEGMYCEGKLPSWCGMTICPSPVLRMVYLRGVTIVMCSKVNCEWTNVNVSILPLLQS